MKFVEIVEKFNTIVDELYDSFTANTTSIKMEDVLLGTKYLKQERPKTGKMNSIFDDIGSLSKYSSTSKALFN